MEVFTIEHSIVKKGAVVESLFVRKANKRIPAVIIGEKGKGRKLGVLPVRLAISDYWKWQKEGTVKIFFARVGTTKNGGYMLFSMGGDPDQEEAMFVLKTGPGFRGGNQHTGDKLSDGRYEPFPGKILCKGIVAQGDGSRRGGGEQYVAVIPKDKVLRIVCGGTLPETPQEHYYIWNEDNQMFILAGEEKIIVDII